MGTRDDHVPVRTMLSRWDRQDIGVVLGPGKDAARREYLHKFTHWPYFEFGQGTPLGLEMGDNVFDHVA